VALLEQALMSNPVSGQRILIVEESATLRYILGNLAQKRGYELLAVDSFQSAIETLEHVTQNLHGAIIGWPHSEHQLEAKHLLILLDREPYSDLPVIMLSNDAELEILNWTSGRKASAMVPWESYQEAIVSLQVMKTHSLKPLNLPAFYLLMIHGAWLFITVAC
jgi:CheY-like chemotaxis protein